MSKRNLDRRRTYWLVIDTQDESNGTDAREFMRLENVTLRDAIKSAKHFECAQVTVRVYTSLCGYGRRY